jgi:DNA-directed RNA polymerase subunit K
LIWPNDEFTGFEVSRLVGARSLQIALGAPILIKTDKTSPIEIAKEEFKNQLIPITIKRTMPDGTKVAVESKKAIKNWINKYGRI